MSVSSQTKLSLITNCFNKLKLKKVKLIKNLLTMKVNQNRNPPNNNSPDNKNSNKTQILSNYLGLSSKP